MQMQRHERELKTFILHLQPAPAIAALYRKLFIAMDACTMCVQQPSVTSFMQAVVQAFSSLYEKLHMQCNVSLTRALYVAATESFEVLHHFVQYDEMNAAHHFDPSAESYAARTDDLGTRIQNHFATLQHEVLSSLQEVGCEDVSLGVSSLDTVGRILKGCSAAVSKGVVCGPFPDFAELRDSLLRMVRQEVVNAVDGFNAALEQQQLQVADRLYAKVQGISEFEALPPAHYRRVVNVLAKLEPNLLAAKGDQLIPEVRDGPLDFHFDGEAVPLMQKRLADLKSSQFSEYKRMVNALSKRASEIAHGDYRESVNVLPRAAPRALRFLKGLSQFVDLYKVDSDFVWARVVLRQSCEYICSKLEHLIQLNNSHDVSDVQNMLLQLQERLAELQQSLCGLEKFLDAYTERVRNVTRWAESVQQATDQLRDAKLHEPHCHEWHAKVAKSYDMVQDQVKRQSHGSTAESKALETFLHQIRSTTYAVETFWTSSQHDAVAHVLHNLHHLDLPDCKEAEREVSQFVVQQMIALKCQLKEQFLKQSNVRRPDFRQFNNTLEFADRLDGLFCQEPEPLLPTSHAIVDSVVPLFTNKLLEIEAQAHAEASIANLANLADAIMRMIELTKEVRGPMNKKGNKMASALVDRLAGANVNMLDLGECLSTQCGITGQEAVSELAPFKAVRIQRHKLATSMTLDHALHVLHDKQPAAITDEVRDALTAAYLKFKSVYDAHLEQFLFSFTRPPVQDLVDLVKQRVHPWAGAGQYHQVLPEIPELTAGVFAVWSILQCEGYKDLNQSDKDVKTRMEFVMEPHVVQVLAIFRLMRVDRPAESAGLGGTPSTGWYRRREKHFARGLVPHVGLT